MPRLRNISGQFPACWAQPYPRPAFPVGKLVPASKSNTSMLFRKNKITNAHKTSFFIFLSPFLFIGILTLKISGGWGFSEQLRLSEDTPPPPSASFCGYIFITTRLKINLQSPNTEENLKGLETTLHSLL